MKIYGIILFAFLSLAFLAQLASAQNEAFTKLGQFPGGRVLVLAMKGDVLFTGTGPLLEIWRVSSGGVIPENYINWPGTSELKPEKIGELNFEDYEINGMEIDGNTMYMSNSKGLVVMDITNPANPQITSTYYKEPYGKIKFRNGLLYVSTDFYESNIEGHSFKILDVKNPQSITELGSFKIPIATVASLERFEISGNYAYLPLLFNIKEALVFIVDISNPARISEVSRINVTPSDMGISVVQVDESRKLLFLLEYRHWLRAYDISDIAHPVLLGSLGNNVVEKSVLGWASDMKIRGNYAYFSAFYTGVNVVDISNPSNLKFVGTGKATSRMGYVSDIILNGGYAYMANMGSGFSIFNIANPIDPFYVFQLDTHGIFYDVLVQDAYAYIAADNEVMVFDISSLSAPKHIGSVEWARASIGGIKGNYIFAHGGWREMAVIDVSNPNKPAVVNKYADHTAVGEIINDRMYLTQGILEVSANPEIEAGIELHILDISALPAIKLLGKFNYLTGPNSVQPVATKGNYAYAGGDSNGIRILDISNPANIRLVGRLMNGASKLTEGTIIDGSGKVIITAPATLDSATENLIDTRALKYTGEITHDGLRAKEIVIQGNYMYVLSDYYLVTFDISNPANPVQTSKLANKAWRLGGEYGAGQVTFKLWKNYLVGNGDTVVMWDITNPAQPTIAKEFKLPAAFPGVAAGFFFVGDIFFDAIQYRGIYTYSYGPPDNTPPTISNIVASATDYYSTITFDTNEIASGVVNYGTSSGSYTKQAQDGYKTTHSVRLINLEQDTTYYYIIESKDPSGNSAQSTERAFKTIADVPGWRDGFDDETKVSVKESTTLRAGDVILVPPANKFFPAKYAKISPIPSWNNRDIALGNSDQFRILLEFALPAAPGGISSAEIRLDETSVQNGATNQTYSLHSLTGGTFDDFKTTWTNRNAADAWTTTGGDFNPTIIDHFDASGDLIGKSVNFTVKGISADNSLDSLAWGSTVLFLIKQKTAGYAPRNDWFSGVYLQVVPSIIQGSITSIQINHPPTYSWDKFYSTATTPSGTNIKFSILDASANTPLCTGLTGKGDDISICILGKTSIKLKADMTTTDPLVIPTISDWKISWKTGGVLPQNAYIDIMAYFYSNGTVLHSGPPGGKTITGISALPESGSISVLANRFNDSFANFSADSTNENYVAFTVNNLKPNTNYRVKKDGVLKETVMADPSGNIGFNNSVW